MRISDWSSDVCSSDLLVDCREGDGNAAAAFLLLRMMSAAFMATAMPGALVLPDTMVGMMEVSTTRSPSTTRTRSEGSTTELASGPIRQVPPIGTDVPPNCTELARVAPYGSSPNEGSGF